MRGIARERGGRCLSTSYKNASTPLLWICKHGHHWKASPASVKSGSRRKGTWCPECYNWRRRFHAKHSIELMANLATARGGTCVSPEYCGSKTKLTWECAFGHRWQAKPACVVQGTWCPVCARHQRLRLSQFRDIATNRGGACLSEAHLNERAYSLVALCGWARVEAVPAKVKRGSWCPKCANMHWRNSLVVGSVNRGGPDGGAAFQGLQLVSRLHHYCAKWAVSPSPTI